jgi:hypothetical protein
MIAVLLVFIFHILRLDIAWKFYFLFRDASLITFEGFSFKAVELHQVFLVSESVVEFKILNFKY